MRLAFVHARAETLQLVRFPMYSLPTLALPALLMLVLGDRLGDADPERLLAGFAATALLTVTFFQFGVGIATNRMFPWEHYLRTLPIGPGVRLTGRVLSALAFALASLGVVSLVAVAVYDARLSAVRWAALVITLLAGAVPLALFGIALGYLLPPRAALPVANLLFIPLAAGGMLWGKPDELPRSADVVSQLLLTRSWIEMLELSTEGGEVPAVHVFALAG
jgi:ABC-2 type transport system permease protein